MEKADALADEVKAFLSDGPVLSETGTNGPDDEGLPYESIGDFSTEPVEFAEMAERMLKKVENLFDLTAVCSRHSEKYLQACALLERGVKYLGSACVTKSAMERQKHVFPELSQLTTMKLYRMVSFNYRKLDTALTENLQKGNDLYPELLDMEFRYFNLLRRLRATETRIYNYNTGHDFGSDNYAPYIEGTAFSAKSWTKRYTQDREEAAAFRSAPAFPLIRNAEQLRKKESGIRIQDPAENTVSEIQNAAKNEMLKAERGKRDIPHSKETSGTYKDSKGRVHIDVSGSRQRLVKEAHESGDPDLIMKIAAEPPEKLYERYRHGSGERQCSGPIDPSRSGP